MTTLLNKPYVNGVILRGQNHLYSKCCLSLLQKLCQQWGQDLSKEILYVSVGQMAAKLQAVKVGSLKKHFAAQPESNHMQPRFEYWTIESFSKFDRL